MAHDANVAFGCISASSARIPDPGCVKDEATSCPPAYIWERGTREKKQVVYKVSHPSHISVCPHRLRGNHRQRWHCQDLGWL